MISPTVKLADALGNRTRARRGFVELPVEVVQQAADHLGVLDRGGAHGVRAGGTHR